MTAKCPSFIRSIFACFFMLFFFLFQSCIGEDFVDDFIEPLVRINNPVSNLAISSTHTFEATFLNNTGTPEQADIIWESSDGSVINIDSNGIATGIAEGEAIISARVESGSGQFIEDNNRISVTQDGDAQAMETVVMGNIVSKSSYVLEGSFTLEETASGTGLRLFFEDDYRASSSLPGLYLYLSNNPNSPNGALEVGEVTTFSGAHSYAIPNANITTYGYLLYWCKPFSVKVGDGFIAN